MTKMLAALGPRLQQLAIRTSSLKPDTQDSLVPAVLKHCPLLTRLEIVDAWRGYAGPVRTPKQALRRVPHV
jgi:hypothetical protein